MNIDFSTPTWLVFHYHFVGTCSFILNSVVLYLVVFVSSKLDNFRYYLLCFQILCMLTDFYLTFLLQPIPLFPIIAGFCTGGIIILLMVSMMECLTLCFVRKHQGIAQIMHRHVINPIIIFLITLSTASGTILSLVTFMLSGLGRDQQIEFVRENYPFYYTEFSSLLNFAIYEFNFIFKLIAVGCFIAVTLFAIFFSFLIIDIFTLLAEVRRKISAKNFQRHQAAVISLVAQLATSSMCLLPPVGLVIAIISHYEHSQSKLSLKQIVVRILLAIFALHSTVNASVLILTTPSYRGYIKRIFIRKRTRSTDSVWVSAGVHSMVKN
ncbi:hypothetical protein CRE_06602 [Caenorhabditis remanei]|uniref:G-protein coupled receptors family 1 profile domain-containing protein n=1 Tax=Caenorhabditis remanei TaxID=31234 RepID=E3M1R3_CAERE|nr:hypothetical protein CRE_06602 [Caenorhabditis remanei]